MAQLLIVGKLTTDSIFRFLNLHPPNPGSFVLTISLSTYLAKIMRDSPVKLPEPKSTIVLYETDSANLERLSLSNGGRNLISCVPNVKYVVVVFGMIFDKVDVTALRP